MKFQNYLNEDNSSEIEKANNIIEKDCQPYIKLIKFSNIKPLLRGMSSTDDLLFSFKETRKDRRPKKTSLEDFRALNKWLEENGHNKRSESFSCSSEKNRLVMKRTFGKLFYVFPIGDFSYTWIKSMDYNLSDMKTGWTPNYVTMYFNGKQESVLKDELKKELKNYFFTDKGIELATYRGYEIWINCKYYYIFDYDLTKWDGNKIVLK